MKRQHSQINCKDAETSQQMTFEILLNPSVVEIDEERLSRQAREIWSLFKYKQYRLGLKITTGDLAAIARQYNARLNEIRHALAPIGLMIDEIRGQAGNNTYEIVPIEESTFWQDKVVKKGLEWKWK